MKPGSSNISSLEQVEDLTPTGVSCSISCISDITEWDTALQHRDQTVSPASEKRHGALGGDEWVPPPRSRGMPGGSPPVPEAHPQPLRLLPLLPLQALKLLLLHLPVDLELFIRQAHGSHTAHTDAECVSHAKSLPQSLLQVH